MQSGSEFSLIGHIRTLFQPPFHPGLGIGDDAAVLPPAQKDYLVTTDAMVDGVHFLSGSADFFLLGRKSFAVNLSDLAAMGAYPVYAFLTLGLPSAITPQQIEELLAGMKEMRDEYRFDLMGGDTVSSPVFFLSITLMGLPLQKPLLRSGAKPGDHIYVTGSLGDSAAGLAAILGTLPAPLQNRGYFLGRHNNPHPRIEWMKTLLKTVSIHAAADVSDGLLADLGHICEESGTGYTVDLDTLPWSRQEAGPEAASHETWWINQAAGGGEDYEIVFTTPDLLDCADLHHRTGIRLTRIGTVTAGGRELKRNGQMIDPSQILHGYDHLRANP